MTIQGLAPEVGDMKIGDGGDHSVEVKAKTKVNPIMSNGFPQEAVPQPEYIQHRIQMFDRLKAEHDAWVAKQPVVPIKISLADGRRFEGESWKTSPMDIAKLLGQETVDKLVIAKVNGELWDTTRPLQDSCVLELLDFDHEEGRAVFWHSSAHVLGEACERHYGCHLCIGPPVEDGFYYEMDTPGRNVTQADYPAMDALAKSIIKERQRFERLEISKENLLEMFQHNAFKVHLIRDKIPDGTSTTVYRCGTRDHPHRRQSPTARPA